MSYGRFPQVGAAARRQVCALLAGCLLLLAGTLRPAVVAPAATQAPTGAAQAEPVPGRHLPSHHHRASAI